MKLLSTKIHGIADYSMAFILCLSPWVFNFNEGAETLVPVTLGVLTFLYSFATNYELGLIPIISFKTHLVVDFVSGVVLATSPWLFGFQDQNYMPHLILGLIEIVVVIITDTRLSARPTTGRGGKL